jgi:hypothetical protein
MLGILDVEAKKEPLPAGTRPELQQGGFDLIWDNGPVGCFSTPTSLPCLLGAYNERDKTQVRPLAGQRALGRSSSSMGSSSSSRGVGGR